MVAEPPKAALRHQSDSVHIVTSLNRSGCYSTGMSTVVGRGSHAPEESAFPRSTPNVQQPEINGLQGIQPPHRQGRRHDQTPLSPERARGPVSSYGLDTVRARDEVEPCLLGSQRAVLNGLEDAVDEFDGTLEFGPVFHSQDLCCGDTLPWGLLMAVLRHSRLPGTEMPSPRGKC